MNYGEIFDYLSLTRDFHHEKKKVHEDSQKK